MPDWSAIRTQLGTWVQARTGLPVHWNKRPQGWINEDNGYVILRIIGDRNVGNDMLTYSYDATAAAGEEITYAQEGTKQFTFQCQVRTWQQSDDVDAVHYVSLMRDSIALPQLSKAIFDVAEIDYVSVLNKSEIDEVIDGREMSIANIDFLFNAYSTTDDTATGYVETINDFEFYDVDNPSPPLWTGDIDVT